MTLIILLSLLPIFLIGSFIDFGGGSDDDEEPPVVDPDPVPDPETPATDGDDTLYGQSGNDDLSGGAGDDLVAGGVGEDTVIGGPGDDEAYGEQNNDTLYGNDGNDTLSGGFAHDDLFGGSGDDLLFGGGSHNTLSGGQGSDTLLGSGIDDSLYGGADDNNLDGGRGRDHLYGGSGDDTIFGEVTAGLDFADHDEIYGGSGRDKLYGGEGDDTLDDGSDSVSDVLYGGEGNDLLRVDPEEGRYSGDYLYGGGDEDTLLGGADNDIIEGGDGSTLYGRTGNDDLESNDWATVYGGDGDDGQVWDGNAEGTYYGDTGDDEFHTIGDNSNLFVGDGNDQFTMYGGGNVTGGAGVDTFNLTGYSVSGEPGIIVHDFDPATETLNAQIFDPFDSGQVSVDALSDFSDALIDAGLDPETPLYTTSMAQVGDDLEVKITLHPLLDYDTGEQIILLKGVDGAGFDLSSVNVTTFGDGFQNLNFGDEGDNRIVSYSDQVYFGGDGEDKIYVDFSEGSFHGDDDNDYFHAILGNVSLYGGDGDDVFELQGYGEITGGEGTDTFLVSGYTSLGGSAQITIHDFEPATEVLQVVLFPEGDYDDPHSSAVLRGFDRALENAGLDPDTLPYTITVEQVGNDLKVSVTLHPLVRYTSQEQVILLKGLDAADFDADDVTILNRGLRL